MLAYNTNMFESDTAASTHSIQNNNSSSNHQLNGNRAPPNVDIYPAYASDYINAVKENRSIYGNYVDNSLAFDPHKEHKSIMNVVYETDGYNPWGKPGGGAPKLDNSGQLKTKIVGTLRWNLSKPTNLKLIII